MKVYAAYFDDKIRLNSSSGGVFSRIASEFDVVYGVALTSDCYGCEFVRIEGDISSIRGSKYLQAKVGESFKNVKNDLLNGKRVLFSGTGCQINGLKGFLGKEYENLYCVDVICHGVPSPKLWREYVQYVESKVNTKLINVNFRCKDNGWSDFGLKRIDSNNKSIYISKDKDPYMLMFLRDYCLRPSCYECIAKQHKLSDLTIADFWGINEVLPEMNDSKGVSLVLLRTSKGLKLFDCIKSDIIFKEVSYEEGVRANPSEYQSVKRPEERNVFFKDLSSMSFEKLKNKYAVPARISLKSTIKKSIKKFLMLIGC